MGKTVIEIEITAQNSQAIAALKQVADAFNQTASKANTAGESSSSGFTEAFSEIAATGKQVVSVLQQISNAVNGLVSRFGSVGQSGAAAMEETASAAKKASDAIGQESASVVNAAQKETTAVKQIGQAATDTGEKIKKAGNGASFTSAKTSGEGFLNTLSKIGMSIMGVVETLRTVKETAEMVFGPGFDYTRQIETARLGVAGIIMSMTTLNGKAVELGDAMQISNQAIDKLQKASSQIGLPLKDMVTAFQSIVGPGLAAKMSMDEIVQFTVTGTKAVKSMMGPMANDMQITQELRSMVSGNIDQDSQVARALGITTTQIQQAKQSADGLFKYLQDKLSGFKAIADVYPTTMNGAIERFKSMFEQGSGKLFSSFFDEFKDDLNEITDYLFKIDEKTKEINFNPDIVNVVNEIKNGLTDLKKDAEELAPSFSWVKEDILPALKDVGKALRDIGSIIEKELKIELKDSSSVISFFAQGFRDLAHDIAEAAGYLKEFYDWMNQKLGRHTTESYDSMAKFRKNEDTNNLSKINQVNPNDIQTKTPPSTYDQASKQVDIASEAEKGRLAQVIAELQNQLKEISAKTQAGIQLSLEEQAKVAAINLQIEQEKLNSNQVEKSLVNGLYSTDTDGAHKTDIDRKIAGLDAAAKAMEPVINEAQKSFNQLSDTIIQFGNIAGATGQGIGAMSQQILKAGEEQLGLTYHMGGDGVSSTDCGEFTKDAFKKVGINLVDRMANDQYDQYAKAGAIKNDLSQAKPGDLLFFYYPGTQEFAPGETLVGHVGIYAGENKMIHASSSRGQVAYTGIDIDHLVGIGDTSKLIGADTGANAVTDYAGKANEFKKILESSMVGVTEAKAKALKFGADMLDKAAEVEAEYKTLLGDTTAKAYYDIDQKYNAMKLSLKPGGAAMNPALDLIDKMVAIEKNRADFTQSQKDLEQNNQKIVDSENSLFMAVANGTKTGADAIKAFADSYKTTTQKTADKLKDELNKAQDAGDLDTVDKIRTELAKIPAAINDFVGRIIDQENQNLQNQIDLINANPNMTSLEKSYQSDLLEKQIHQKNAASYRAQANVLDTVEGAAAWNALPQNVGKNIDLEKQALRSKAAIEEEKGAVLSLMEQVNNAGRQGLENGLVNFFEEGYKSCHNLIDAVRDLASSILNEMNKVFSQDIARRLMVKLWPSYSANGSSAQTTTPDASTSQFNTALNYGSSVFNQMTTIVSGTNSILSQLNNVLIQFSTSLSTAANVSSSNNVLSSNPHYDESVWGEFAEGGNMDSGQVKGPGTGTSDSILAYLGNFKKFIGISDGEYVIRNAAVKRFGTAFFDKLNSGLIPEEFFKIKAKFADGGVVSGKTIAGVQDIAASLTSGDVSMPLKIINVSDPNEIGRYLRSKPGEQVLLNFMKNNSEVVHRFIKR